MRMDRQIVGRRFSDTTRFVIPFDPLVTGSRASRAEIGTVARTTRDASGSLDVVWFRTSSVTRQLEIHEDGFRLGDVLTHRVFPNDLVWAGLVGRSATLEHASGRPWMLWLTR